jgi:NTF2 fold immunity protein
VALTASSVYAESPGEHSYQPSEGLVPNAETAIKIAVAVWEPIYGKESIERQKPYTATLANGVWYVEGSLPKEFIRGGVAIAEISKADGRTLRVSHGK